MAEPSERIGRHIESRRTDTLRADPRAEVIPTMTPDEFDALVLDIEVNGIDEPLVLSSIFDLKDEPGTLRVLDGRHRLRAAKALGLDAVPCRYFSSDHEAEEFAFMVGAALNRRHLSTAQRKDLAAKLLEAEPQRSDRSIATTTKLSPTTVGKVRAEAEAAGDVSKVDTRTDSMGRKQPASKSESAPIARASGAGHRGQKPATHGRKRPPWLRDFNRWCKWTRPEDRALLLDMDARLHEALAMNETDR